MNHKIPRVTVDGVIIQDNEILLIRRKNEPFKGKWALPGGFVEYGEKTEDAVLREIFEETGLKTKIYDLVGVYSDPVRDPRGHTITVVYLLEIFVGDLGGSTDAMYARSFNIHDLPALAFDHEKIIKDVIEGEV